MSFQLSPFQKRMLADANKLLASTTLAQLKWNPEGPVQISESKGEKVVVLHFRGSSDFGFLTVHVWFDDVNETKSTFKIRRQILFAGRNGELKASEDDHAPQIFWGGSLGWRCPI